MDTISAAGAVVLGASVDSVDSHRRFASKYNLNYPLLSDQKGELSAALGVLKKTGPIKRSARVTFLIDAEGRIARVFSPVKPGKHADEVIAALQG